MAKEEPEKEEPEEQPKEQPKQQPKDPVPLQGLGSRGNDPAVSTANGLQEEIARLAAAAQETVASVAEQLKTLKQEKAGEQPAEESEAPRAQLEFVDKVAVITGAGLGLGKEYAKLLASRGAKVVVNDLGTGPDGSGRSPDPADQTVAEIKEAGGEAVASHDSVVDGEKVIKRAIDAYGRIDILINNAGVLSDKTFRKMSDKDWDAIYQVCLLGMYKCTKAAWPYMEKQQYGRVVFVSSSSGLYGNFGQSNYSAMNSALFGLASSLAMEGEKRHIRVNTVAPWAATRALEEVLDKDTLKALRLRPVANLVAYLCHEQCSVSGEVFEIAGLSVSKVRYQRSRGARFKEDYTLEDLVERFDEIRDFSDGAEYPKASTDIIDEEMRFFKKPKNESKL